MNFRLPVRVLACQLKFLQCSSFITLCLGSFRMQLCYNSPLKFLEPRNVEYNEVFLLICVENVF